jgi:release factor glutamine methyltransferase
MPRLPAHLSLSYLMTLRDALAETSARILRRDAETLLAHVLGRPRAWLLAHPEEELDAAQAETFLGLAARRAAGEPLQYLTGVQEFYGLSLRVTPEVLIPRPETEHLVEAVLLWATQFHDGRILRIADVGTGSGAIAIALATHLAGVEIMAIDQSEGALAVAEENAHALGCRDRIRFLQSDLLQKLDHTRIDPMLIPRRRIFDAIVSNPPYIPLGDAATMQIEVVRHEPHSALFAGNDGLSIYKRLIPQAHTVLRPRGLLAMEIGFGQRAALEELLADWDNVRFVDDYAGIPRVVLAERV